MSEAPKVSREAIENILTVVRHELVDVRGDLARVERALETVETLIHVIRLDPSGTPAVEP